ncbi:MAG: hypothetical protein KAY65_10940 [Planctomycetes bacterium]|nr:hypothetical protein [Planctomycetota bacterium]
MSKTRSTVVVALIVLTGCAGSPTYKSHGYELITTNARSGQIDKALHLTYEAMGDWVQNPDGSRTNPSFSQSGKSFSGKQGRANAARVQTEFKSKDGVHCVIETVAMSGGPTVILLSSDNDKATMRLHNEFVRSLYKLGVKPKNE